MDKIKVSIIVPIYNVEKHIKRCIDSLINQTLKEIEIVLIDDESPDNCGTICDNYANLDSRIKVIHKKNEGLGLTRNVGIENAKGKYIAFIDSDDYVELNMFERMYNEIEETSSDAVICHMKILTKDNEIILEKMQQQQDTFKENDIDSQILPTICGSKKYKILVGSSCNILYKKEIIDSNNIRFLSEREYVSEDYIFNYEFFSKCKKIKFIKDCLYVYCENEGSLTHTYSPSKTGKFINLYNCLRKKVKSNFEECYFGIDTLYIQNMRVAIIQEIKMNPDKKKIKTNIMNICSDKLLCEILQKYDTKYMTTKQKIFTFLMKYKLVSLIYLIVK